MKIEIPDDRVVDILFDLERSIEILKVDCDGDGCKVHLPYAYMDDRSAKSDMNDGGWVLKPDGKCLCKKCLKKRKRK